MKTYDHKKIEKKWQNLWKKKQVYHTHNNFKKKKYYVLDMFPYPSGSGLHVGHPKGYIGSDVFARMKRMQGFNVLHPMGYDAFGLPAEQYAIEHNINPKQAVEKNVKTFEKQLSTIGLSYDWDRRVNTTDPSFYKWTQWIFLKIYNSWYNKNANKAEPIEKLIKIFEKSGNEKIDAVHSEVDIFSASAWKEKTKKEKQDVLMKYRLAYEGYSEVNWCPKLGTVLANDEVIEGESGLVSERGGYQVEKKKMRQWFMRITAYADRLLVGLDNLNWSEHIKEIQKNWIGKSEGAEIEFEITNYELRIKVFTTRPDTIFGATYLVLAPEHETIKNLKLRITNWNEVEKYIEEVKNKTDIERTNENKTKTGVELKGIKAINPATKEEISVWIADYVLVNYGTGAIMAVPQHDQRDREFAEKYNLPIVDKPLVDVKDITKKVGGKIVTHYKMRDAIFARQRYWGEPIPLVHNKDGIISELPLKNLPLKLPLIKSYQPTGTGESPLATVEAWIKKGYETNTMPGWAGSSWYFLRYMDPKNNKVFADSKAIKYWKDVDMYVGGQEHATGHLLYSRFWHKFLKDYNLVVTEEPFKTLHNQGMILGGDNRKMSKRWGNVINPDDIVKTYGADTLRVYEMFMGPFGASLAWSTDNIIGSRRFLERVWKLQRKVFTRNKSEQKLENLLHKTIKKVTEDIENFAFNTSVSSMMILVNEMERQETLNQKDFELFLKILSPFAPHIAEEMWNNLGEKKSINLSSWPKFNADKFQDSEIKIIIQINGKLRGEIMIKTTDSEEEIKNQALANQVVSKYITGMTIKKIIYVKNRLINIVL